MLIEIVRLFRFNVLPEYGDVAVSITPRLFMEQTCGVQNLVGDPAGTAARVRHMHFLATGLTSNPCQGAPWLCFVGKGARTKSSVHEMNNRPDRPS